MFFVLTSSLTASRLHCLDIRYIVNTGDKTTFHFHKLQENWRKGNAPHSLSIYSYRTDEELCVVKTLNRYLKKVTEERRERKTQLLLSLKKPYRDIVSSTVSGWIKTVMELANVNTEVFKGHSTRSASTSEVSLKVLSLIF